MIWDIVFKDFEYFTDEVGRRGPIDVILTRPSRSGTYTMCASGEVETVSHLILRCTRYSKLRRDSTHKGRMPLWILLLVNCLAFIAFRFSLLVVKAD